MTPDSPIVIASYPDRHRADAVAEELRRSKIGAAVIPSADRAGAWDIVILRGEAGRARMVIEEFPGY